MSFDRRLPIKERIKKRRKQRRKRLFIVFTFLLMSVMAFVVINNALRHDEEDFAFSDNVSVQGTMQVTTLTEPTPSAIPGIAGIASSIFTNDEMFDENNVDMDDESKVDAVSDNPTEESGAQGQNAEIGNTVQVNPNYNELKSELEKYISGFQGQYGIYFIDLENNYEFGINDTDEYIAASTVKVPLNYYVYREIADGEVDPEKTLAYNEADFEGGTGILQLKKLEGKTYKIKYLLELSITHSDNIATNMLLRYFGRKTLKKYMRAIGGTVVDDNKNVSCPKDMAVYLKKIYEFCNSNGQLGEELKHNLCNTMFNDRLPKLLPEEVEIAHKVGNQIGAVHDVGIIYTEKPYILAVMSNDVVSDEESNNVIAEISKKVYDVVKDR
ncbi:MAG: Extended-spectrum beta-lactamase PER-1 precursor [Firmicutes bacterium ADurb.Bin419]|nr:MAG: Extended-spectrum beta-lactamase PER-1 precursor [Firmicutes bacterium ADurb.Bin419]